MTGQGGEYNVSGLLVSLKIGALIDQKDKESILFYLKREIRLLFEREGITLLM